MPAYCMHMYVYMSAQNINMVEKKNKQTSLTNCFDLVCIILFHFVLFTHIAQSKSKVYSKSRSKKNDFVISMIATGGGWGWG